MFSQQQIRNLVIIAVVFLLIPTGLLLFLEQFPRDLETELSNRNLLSTLAEDGAQVLKDDPEAGIPELLDSAKYTLRDGTEWSGLVYSMGIEDPWGSWLRLKEVEPGFYEWRSLGRDRYLTTKDDRISTFRAGEVVMDPALEEEE